MPAPLAVYTAALALAVVATTFLAVLGLLRRRVAGSAYFVGLVCCGAVYAFGSLFEIRAAGVDELGAWLAVEYLGIAPFGPFWFLLALTLADRFPRRLHAFVPVLFVVPALVVVAAFANGRSGWLYASLERTLRGPFVVPAMTKGPAYWLNLAYMNAFILAGTVVAFHWVATARGAYRRQALVALAGCLVPWVGMAVYQAGLSPWGLDLAPFGVAVSAVIFAWGVFRHRLMDLSPVFHENVFEGMRDGVLVVDGEGRMVGANPSLAGILPEASPERVGTHVEDLLAGRPAVLEALRGGAGGDIALGADAGSRYFAATPSPMRDRRGRRLGTIWTFSDVSARVELLARLEELASTDPLTGLLNRRAFLAAAGRELERARRWGLAVALAVADLDHFKAVNDRRGHEAGDAVLVAATKAMRDRVRATDLVCRSGGEEFIVLMPNTGRGEAAAVAERVREGVAEREVVCAGLPVGVTISIGVAHRERLGEETIDVLLREADAALYRAKEAGRNRVETA